jgi:hypothetical protein
MVTPKIAVGIQVGTQPPLGTVRAVVLFARLARLESFAVLYEADSTI